MLELQLLTTIILIQNNINVKKKKKKSNQEQTEVETDLREINKNKPSWLDVTSTAVVQESHQHSTETKAHSDRRGGRLWRERLPLERWRR